MPTPTRILMLLLLMLMIWMLPDSTAADWCRHEKTLDQTLDLTGSESLTISAGAGDLEIIAGADTDQAVIHGKACVSRESWLTDVRIETLGGKQAELKVLIPDTSNGFSFFSIKYAYLDLSIEVPAGIPLVVNDSSGDALFRNTASLTLRDSSGDIEIEGVHGTVTIWDSSGDIDVTETGSDLVIEADSSGDIYATGVSGSVLVKRDSSGDIRLSRVSGDVTVERDSSGDIKATDVGGNFRVIKDGSGDIHTRNVSGEIELPQKR